MEVKNPNNEQTKGSYICFLGGGVGGGGLFAGIYTDKKCTLLARGFKLLP